MSEGRLWRWWTALGLSGLVLLAVFGLASSPSEDAANASVHGSPSGPPPRPSRRRLYGGPVLVWLILLGILALSCWSAFVPLGSFNPTINLLLAAIILLMLATFLMDLRRASAVVRLVACAGLFWVIFLFTLTFTDYLSRRPTGSIEAAQGAALDNRQSPARRSMGVRSGTTAGSTATRH